jgi:chitodextrinase
MTLQKNTPRRSAKRIDLSLAFAFCALFFSASTFAGQGITVNGSTSTLWWDDGGWTGSWNYLCLADNCSSGTKANGKYQRVLSGQTITVGNVYQIQIKVQDNATGQYISPLVAVTAASATTTSSIANSSTPASSVALSSKPASSVVASSKPASSVALSSKPASSTPKSSSIPVSSVSSSVNNTGGGQFGIDSSGKLYHQDGGQTGSWNYLCLDGNCSSGTKVNGRYERAVTVAVGSTHTLEFKVQDNATGQCLSGVKTVIYAAAGVSTTTNCAIPDTQAPSVPTGLNGTAPNGHSVALTWAAATDDNGVSKYDVYRGGVLVGSPTTTSFTNSGLNEQTAYSFTVRACDAAANCSAQSAAKIVTTPVFVPDTTAPSIPTGLTSTNVTNIALTLNWAASTDTGGVVAKYEVYRAATLIASPTTNSYTNSGLTASTNYSYTVKACDDSNNCSVVSAALTVKTAAAPPPDFSKLDWTTNSYNLSKVGPLPRANPPEALPTPINGAAPTINGFAFDINGSTLNWRWGAYTVALGHNLDAQQNLSADADLEMYCSTDDGLRFSKAKLVNGSLTIPCTGVYTYFFRWKTPGTISIDPATQWDYTGYFTTAGARVNVNSYTPFTDGSANWMRFRHPLTNDGVTAAIMDAKHNNSLLRDLDRYTLWVNDSPGAVNLDFNVTGNVLRVESMTRTDSPDGQQFFVVNQNPGFGNAFSYGQVIQFEITAVAGRISAQTYNDFQYYTVGFGWNSRYGDPRLASAGKASTSQLFSTNGTYSALEKDAIFTQPRVGFNTSKQMDDFILGHHLFHGIDPKKNFSSLFDDPTVKIGERTCGNCHFRDGRGSEIIQTAKGPRLPPPMYGSEILMAIEGRQTGTTWDGSVPSVEQQVKNALINDHKIDPAQLPGRVLELLTTYSQELTVPSRKPGSYDMPGVENGDRKFLQVGCSNCHTPIQRTSHNAAPDLRDLVIRPYTDMKLWDLGQGTFRTAPLWGLGHNIELLTRHNRAVLFMHDGASTSVDAAVQRHNSSGATVKAAYNALSASDRADIEAFVKTL